MAIIIEGFDNSGKSTLAASFGLEVVHPGPRPTDEHGLYRCMAEQMRRTRDQVVMDRVTAISTPCYSGHFRSEYQRVINAMLYTPNCVLIYCRPPLGIIKDFTRHICKDYDEANKVQWLYDHAEEIVGRYDMLMTTIPHLKYDYTNPDPRVMDLAKQAATSREGWDRWISMANR